MWVVEESEGGATAKVILAQTSVQTQGCGPLRGPLFLDGQVYLTLSSLADESPVAWLLAPRAELPPCEHLMQLQAP